jgi:hypothetical protein
MQNKNSILLIIYLLNFSQIIKTEKKCEEFLNGASYTFCYKCNIYCQNPLNVAHEHTMELDFFRVSSQVRVFKTHTRNPTRKTRLFE